MPFANDPSMHWIPAQGRDDNQQDRDDNQQGQADKQQDRGDRNMAAMTKKVWMAKS
jgi:hypothetical protein